MHTEGRQKSQPGRSASDADHIVYLGDTVSLGREPPPSCQDAALARRADVRTTRRTSEQPHLGGFCALEARREREIWMFSAASESLQTEQTASSAQPLSILSIPSCTDSGERRRRVLIIIMTVKNHVMLVTALTGL